ncbi:type IV pilus secretin PilQ [Rhodoferax lacus]|uniref:Type IV pilus biogenesis and competence protein PilQ n=1 Tax=Rhodoferax lacus TaxID=2184758 RepID=A0A3E1REY4_9BURK|nr:type IV pilus secretin PilQ [Rhodoferax lacus]
MWRRFVFASTLMVLAPLAWAQTAIESVTGSMQGGVEYVRIDLSKALDSVPAGFTIQAPARIALDFPGVVNTMGRSTIDINEGNLKSVSVVQAGDRTRVVLNLKQPTTYKAEIQGKSLLVMLNTSSANAPSSSAPTVFAENRTRDMQALKDVDFRRSADGSGRVVVTLPNNNVGVDIRQQGKSLVVEFMKSTLSEGLRRRMDVADFGTPIKTVSTTQVGDKVRMVIEPQGVWEHSAYQNDEQFVVEVKEVKVDPKKLTQGIGYNGQKLSLNFQSIEVRSLLQVIADFTNFNIVTSDSVSGSVTLRLQDVPWDQALDIILQAKSLGMRKSGNVIWVAPKDEIATKEKLDLESMTAVQNLEPVKTQSFQINFAKAAEIAVQITGGGGGASPASGAGSARILSARGSVIAEPRTNQLFVTDIPSRLEQVQSLLAKLDVAVRQVVIEARIVEASDTFSKSLGVKLGGSAAGNSGGTINRASGSVNLPASGNVAGTFALNIFNSAADQFLNLEITALESDGKGKVISSPRVVTADQTKALIEQGTELPYQVASSSGATSIQFRKANLKLEVTPQITPEGSIILTLDVNKDTVGQLTPGGYAIDTKHIQTQALVENGGTIVIGGIFTEDQTNQVDKVPFFGDLPILGNLFKSTSKSSNKKEMLVFITPRVLADRSSSN